MKDVWRLGAFALMTCAGLNVAHRASAQDAEIVTVVAPAVAARDPGRGAVTNLPVPRFVSLKTNEGNVRRGPGLTHRVDWVFTRAGMPLRITAEYENWRRVEDRDGAGGWIHYSLLSGVRSVLISEDMAEFRDLPDRAADVVAQAEYGVVAKLLECAPNWCRINADGEKGWVEKAMLWGVEAGEVVD
jgi:SH3-like domain-containing protein